ncbi:MAG: FtsX-like permease family protein, partial [Candidatus Dormibacteraceae bacterium]
MQQITIVVALGGTYDIGKQLLTVGNLIIPCTKVLCFGGKVICPVPGRCGGVVGDQQQAIGLAPGRPGANIIFPIPLTIVGVDPEAENKLSGIAGCVTSGHYLESSTAPMGAVPILLSDRSLLDESISAVISRTTAVAPLIAGQDPTALTGWQSEGTRTIDPNLALQNASLEGGSGGPFLNPSPVWMPGAIQYSVDAGGTLTPTTVPADPTAYANPFVVNARPDFYMPVEAQDVWFRSLQDRYQTGQNPGNQWDLVGRFNPACLPSFNSNGAGQIGTFVPPVLTTTDGKTIGPNRSIAGYLDSPPLMLTTLQGAEYFADSKIFSGAPGPAFISAIRVRVLGTGQLGQAAEARLSRVAVQIRDATGLQVDIVKGSSPRLIQIALPAGKFGRPALTVTQGWASKGVGFRFFQAVSFQNLAIFAVVLVGALILVAQTAYVSVRRRRSELAVLRAVGWPPWRIALLIELEMLILGLTVGAVGLAISVPITVLAHVGPTWWTTAGVVPLSVLIALLAGVIPAVGSMRGTTLSVITQPEAIRERRLPSSSLAFGLRQVIAWRWDVAMGIAALTLGATLVAGIELVAA